MNQKLRQLFGVTIDGGSIRVNCLVGETTGHATMVTTFTKKSDNGYIGNRYCASFLGVYIGEKVLSKIFKNVERMPWNNPGFDFICGKGYKIDVKTGCIRKNTDNTWGFRIERNKIADYFLILALNNRDDLTPMHLWLIPGYILNNKRGVTISEKVLNKWKDYELQIDKVIYCCNIMKVK